MKINGVPFLTIISQNIMYRTAEWDNPREHVPEAERKNRVNKVLLKINFVLPFIGYLSKKIQRYVKKSYCAKKNFLPTKGGGISPYYSLRMIITSTSIGL